MIKLNKRKLEIAQLRAGANDRTTGEKAGVTQQSINLIKHGRPCRIKTAHAIAAALNVDPLEIMEDERHGEI